MGSRLTYVGAQLHSLLSFLCLQALTHISVGRLEVPHGNTGTEEKNKYANALGSLGSEMPHHHPCLILLANHMGQRNHLCLSKDGKGKLTWQKRYIQRRMKSGTIGAITTTFNILFNVRVLSSSLNSILINCKK